MVSREVRNGDVSQRRRRRRRREQWVMSMRCKKMEESRNNINLSDSELKARKRCVCVTSALI